jgi:hypothetical protein
MIAHYLQDLPYDTKYGLDYQEDYHDLMLSTVCLREAPDPITWLGLAHC